VRALVLATDAFGGTGGIAQYTRDIVAAIASYPKMESVTVIPRVIARDPEPIPARVIYLSRAAGKKTRFVGTVLREAARRPRFDLIVCGHINLLGVAKAAAMISGARLLLLTFGMEVWEPADKFKRILIARTDAVASISSFTLEKMRAWASLPHGKTFLLPNAIDLSKYTPGERNAMLAAQIGVANRRVLLTVGRMDAAEQAKGFDEILDLLPKLLLEEPDLIYVAIGDGSDRARLREKARALGIERNTVFPGYVGESEKLDYYRLADVFVMPSRLEGFGYVFLEALAARVPVIASKVDGSREAVMDGSWGLLVDPANANELQVAILSALRNPHVPSRRELEHFSWTSFEKRCHTAMDAILPST
jgi:phosphatidyl-myo-inositol dimannoside synthase